MNRKLITAICLMLAFCIGIFFYAEWQKRKFDASLPEPPAPTEVQAVETETEGGHWHGDEWHAEPHTAGDAIASPQEPAQDESNTSNGDEWLTVGDPTTGVTIISDVDPNEILTKSEIEELNEKIRRGDVHRHPEKLSQREREYLSIVGIDLSMVPPDIRRQRLQEMDRQFHGQFGLKPPPEGYRFNFFDLDKGILNLDENGMPILSESQTGRDVPWEEVSAHFEGDPYVH